MSFCFKKKIKNLTEAYLNGRKHDKWISRVGKYYREAMQNPAKTDIYLDKLLKGSLFDNEEQDTVSNENEAVIVFEYNLLSQEEQAVKKGSLRGKLKYFLLECAAGIEKYRRIISHRKK